MTITLAPVDIAAPRHPSGPSVCSVCRAEGDLARLTFATAVGVAVTLCLSCLADLHRLTTPPAPDRGAHDAETRRLVEALINAPAKEKHARDRGIAMLLGETVIGAKGSLLRHLGLAPDGPPAGAGGS
jgi:hypothetical protein